MLFSPIVAFALVFRTEVENWVFNLYTGTSSYVIVVFIFLAILHVRHLLCED